MHAALRDDFAIEVRKFLQEPDILQKHRTSLSGRLGILVVNNGSTERGCKFVHCILHDELRFELADKASESSLDQKPYINKVPVTTAKFLA
jgi:hypothetical protein